MVDPIFSIMEASLWLRQFRQAILDLDLRNLRDLDYRKPFDIGYNEECFGVDGKLTALHYVAQKKDSEKVRAVIKFLLDRGANPLKSTEDGYVLLDGFSNFGEDTFVEFLRRIPDINMFLNMESTALHISVKHMKKKAVEYCLERGADVNETMKNGCTALHLVLLQTKVNLELRKDIVELLLDHGADVNIPDDIVKYTPLHQAVKCSEEEIIDMILEYEPDMEMEDFMNRTPLLVCFHSSEYNLDMLEKLLRAGSDPNHRAILGLTSLHYLSAKILNDHLASLSAEILIRYGADVNISDFMGNTPLHLAVENRKVSVIKTYLRNGVDLSVENLKGKTAMSLVKNTRSYDKTLSVLIRQIVLQNDLKKLIISRPISDFLESSERIKQMRKTCEKELESMKKKEIIIIEVSHFEIMKSSALQVGKYARNPEVNIIFKNLLRDDDMIYEDELKESIRGGLARLNFENNVEKFFDVFGKRFFQIGSEYLLKYLSNRDMSNLGEVLKIHRRGIFIS